MVEEFDATQAQALPPAIIILVGILLIGVTLEVAGRWLHTRAVARKSRRTRTICYILRYQALLWSLIVGLELTLPRSWLARLTALAGINPLLWLAAVALTLLAVRAVTRLGSQFAEDRGVASTSVLEGMLNFVGTVIVLLVAAGLLGVPIDALLVALAGSSVGLGFALQPPLTNLFAGLMLTASQRFRPGHHIRLSTGQEGRVIDLDWLTTTLDDDDDNIMAVPNVTMLTATVLNFDLPDPKMWIATPISVSRDNDMERVERLTLEVAKSVVREVPGCEPGAAPRLRYPLGLNDYVVRFSVSLMVQDYAHHKSVKYELVKRLEARYQAEGITMSYPLAATHLAELTTPTGVTGEVST